MSSIFDPLTLAATAATIGAAVWVGHLADVARRGRRAPPVVQARAAQPAAIVLAPCSGNHDAPPRVITTTHRPWVVMPEHVHLLLRPDQDDTAAAILKSVKLTVAQLAIARWKRSGDPLLRQVDSATGPRFWQKGGGFDRDVRSMTEFTREVGYIHANPVRRGLVTRATEWSAPLSSVHAWLARHRGEGWTGQPGIDMPPGAGRWDWLRWKGFMQWKQEQAP